MTNDILRLVSGPYPRQKPAPIDLQPTTKPVAVVPRGQTLSEWRSRFE